MVDEAWVHPKSSYTPTFIALMEPLLLRVLEADNRPETPMPVIVEAINNPKIVALLDCFRFLKFNLMSMDRESIFFIKTIMERQSLHNPIYD